MSAPLPATDRVKLSTADVCGPRRQFQWTRLLTLGPALVGGFAIWQGAALGVGGLHAPGPGLWPAIIGGFLLATAAPILFWDHHSAVERLTRQSHRIFIGLVLLCVFIWMLPNLGLPISAFVLLLVWLPLLGKEKVWMSALVSASVAVIVYLIFEVALGVALPPGILANWAIQ